MALLNLKFLSETLGRQTEINVIVPQKSTRGAIGIENNARDEKYKTLLLLHGLSDDGSIWMRHTSIERYAIERGIAVIMPSGARSFYADMKNGDRYYTYISEEVLRIAREFLPLSEKREDTFIAGNSMGGYGALKIALKNPDKFAAAAGLSSVADVEDFMEKYAPHLRGSIFGDGEIAEEENLFYLVKTHNKDAQKPKLYMAVGKQDYMYHNNLQLKELLKNSDYSFQYAEAEGSHTWAFWDTYIQKALDWLLEK